jgi:hypothetical protein
MHENLVLSDRTGNLLRSSLHKDVLLNTHLMKKNTCLKMALACMMLATTQLCAQTNNQPFSPERYAADVLYLTRGGSGIQFAKAGQPLRYIGMSGNRLVPNFTGSPQDARQVLNKALDERRAMTRFTAAGYGGMLIGLGVSIKGIIDNDEMRFRAGGGTILISSIATAAITTPLSFAQHNHLQEAIWLRNRGLLAGDSARTARYNQTAILTRARFFRGYTYEINGVERREGIFMQRIARQLAASPAALAPLRAARLEATTGFWLSVVGNATLLTAIIVNPRISDPLDPQRFRVAQNLVIGSAVISLAGAAVQRSARRNLDRAIYRYNRDIFLQ